MPTLTVHIAETGTTIVACPKDGQPDISKVGHVWYSITDNTGNEKSFGFAPDPQHEGQSGLMGDVPGFVYPNDSTNYLPSDKGKVTTLTVSISNEQYAELYDFGSYPTEHDFVLLYNGLTNSCVDFTWTALSKIGVTPYTSHQGKLLPVSNVQDLATALHDRFGDVQMEVRGQDITDYAWDRLAATAPAGWLLENASSIYQWERHLSDAFAESVAKLDMTGDNYRKYLAAKQQSASQASPIVLDLGQNGVETTALASSSVHDKRNKATLRRQARQMRGVQ